MQIPQRLQANVASTAAGRRWLAELPEVCARLSEEWGIRLAEPYPECHVSLVAPVLGSVMPSVLKMAMPSIIAVGTVAGDFRDREAAALKVWAGNGAPLLLDLDEESGAMLIEQCLPGATLDSIRQPEAADAAAAEVVHALHRRVDDHDDTFDRLADRARTMSADLPERFAALPDPFDAWLLAEAVEGLTYLAESTEPEVLLHGDTHHHNILSATRTPWLAIDPLPMLGEPGYDAVQYLLFRKGDLQDPVSEWDAVIASFCRLLEVDPNRVKTWIFVRLVSDAVAAREQGHAIADLEARNGDLWTARLVHRLRH